MQMRSHTSRVNNMLDEHGWQKDQLQLGAPSFLGFRGFRRGLDAKRGGGGVRRRAWVANSFSHGLLMLLGFEFFFFGGWGGGGGAPA